jgi:broad specificity phosphatase PhoE
VTTFLFVRHAMTTGGPGDPGLSLEGRALAHRAADELRPRCATYVYSSPLRRAYETADAIARDLGLEIIVDDRLRERTNWGDVPGETFADFLERWEACDRRECRARIHSFVTDVSVKYPRATIIAVAHGGIVADELGGHEHWPHCAITEFAA